MELDTGIGFHYVQYVLNAEEQAIWNHFVDLGGRSALRLGLPRSLGQVYAAVYLSPEPLGLEDLMEQLDISKGNASMSLRQLAEWGAVRRLWIKGDRRDYYEASEHFSQVIRQFVSTILKPRIQSTSVQLEGMREDIQRLNGRGTKQGLFMQTRIARLESFHKKISRAVPLLEKIL
ncbi:MAG: hypothetical protein HC904_04715 [Blastochloris sp.]|nr:hypothetical protein [Blastochloris sp.]